MNPLFTILLFQALDLDGTGIKDRDLLILTLLMSSGPQHFQTALGGTPAEASSVGSGMDANNPVMLLLLLGMLRDKTPHKTSADTG